jgi:hypothetical protein
MVGHQYLVKMDLLHSTLEALVTTIELELVLVPKSMVVEVEEKKVKKATMERMERA